MRSTRACLLPLALLLLPPGAAATAAPPHDLHGYTGEAYARDGRLLYREQHLIWRQHGRTQQLVLYRCPDGSVFARKHLHADGDAATPQFRLRDAANGQGVSVQRDGARILVRYRAHSGAPVHERALPLPAHAIIDAGFDAYVLRHWESLLSGVTLHVRFPVPSRREWMDFTVRRVDNARAAASGSVSFRLRLGSWFAFLLPHVDVRYRRADRRLLDYRGPSNLSDARGGNPWVDIRFPAHQVHAELPAKTLAQAAAAALGGSCRL